MDRRVHAEVRRPCWLQVPSARGDLAQDSLSDTLVIVVEATQYGDCVNAAVRLEMPWNRLLVPEGLVRTRFVVEADVLGDDAPEVILTEDEDRSPASRFGEPGEVLSPVLPDHTFGPEQLKAALSSRDDARKACVIRSSPRSRRQGVLDRRALPPAMGRASRFLVVPLPHRARHKE